MLEVRSTGVWVKQYTFPSRPLKFFKFKVIPHSAPKKRRNSGEYKAQQEKSKNQLLSNWLTLEAPFVEDFVDGLDRLEIVGGLVADIALALSHCWKSRLRKTNE